MANDLAIQSLIISRLVVNSDITVRTDVLGRHLTTFSIGGPIQAFVEVQSLSGLQYLMSVLAEHQQSYRIIGAGSNVLVPDRGLHCWLIHLGQGFRTLHIDDDGVADRIKLSVGAGYSLMTLSREVSSKGYAGLAFAGGIPASIGGAVRMNAGAHRGDMAQVVSSVTVVDRHGIAREIPAQTLQFSYRHSLIASDDIVVGAELILQRSEASVVLAERTHCLEERRSRQPLSQPSAGSVFRNPSPEQSAGWLIEKCGLKGYQRGEIQISEKHANWIVNPTKNGTAQEVLDLIVLCQERVERQFGFVLVPELVLLAES